MNAKYNVIAFAVIASSLVACSAMHSIQDKMGDLSVQKKKLADGSAVSFATNLPPDIDWGCKQLPGNQYYNWEGLRTESVLHYTECFGDRRIYLMNQAVDYINQQKLTVNYVNLIIPTEKTFAVGYNKMTQGINMDPNSNAIVVYYFCKKINPKHKIGMTEKDELSVRTISK